MRGEQLDLAQRRHPQLHARAAELGAADALLDDPAVLRELGEVGRRAATSGCSNAIASTRRGQLRPLVGRAGRGQVAQVDDRVAAPGHAVVELDDRLGDRRLRRPHPRERVDHAVDVVHVLVAERVRDAGLGEQPPAAGLRAERQAARDRRRRAGCRASARDRARASSSCRARGGSAPGPGSARGSRASTRGRSSSFAASGRAEPSWVATMCRRRAGLARDDARQQPEVVLDDRSRAPGARSRRSRAAAAGAAGAAGTACAPRAPAAPLRSASRRA